LPRNVNERKTAVKGQPLESQSCMSSAYTRAYLPLGPRGQVSLIVMQT